MIYDAFKREKTVISSSEGYDHKSNSEKIMQILAEKSSPKELRDVIQADSSVKEDFLTKFSICLTKAINE